MENDDPDEKSCGPQPFSNQQPSHAWDVVQLGRYALEQHRLIIAGEKKIAPTYFPVWLLALLATGCNSDFNGGCDFAAVELTPLYAAQILARMKALLALAQGDDSLHEAHYWDFSAQYFEFPSDEKLQEKLEAAYDAHVELDEASELPEALFNRTEYAHMVIEVQGGPGPAKAPNRQTSGWRSTPRPFRSTASGFAPTCATGRGAAFAKPSTPATPNAAASRTSCVATWRS